MPDGTQGFETFSLNNGPISVGPTIVGIIAAEPAQAVSPAPVERTPAHPAPTDKANNDRIAHAAAQEELAAQDKERWDRFFKALMAATGGHIFSEKIAGQKNHTVAQQRQFLFEQVEEFVLGQNGAFFKMAGSNGLIDASTAAILYRPANETIQKSPNQGFTFADAQMMAMYAAQNKDYHTVKLTGTRLQKHMLYTAIMEQNKYLPPEQQIIVKNPPLVLKRGVKDFVPFPDFMTLSHPTPVAQTGSEATPSAPIEREDAPAPKLDEIVTPPAPVAASPYYLLPTGEKTGEANPRDVFAFKTTETPDGDTVSFVVMDSDKKPELILDVSNKGIWRHPDIFITSDVNHPKHPKFHQTQIDHFVAAFNNPANDGVVFEANFGPDVPKVRVVTAEELQNRKIEAFQNLLNDVEGYLNANKDSVLDETFKIGTTVGKVPTHKVFEQTLQIHGADIDVAYVHKTDRQTGEKKIQVMAMMDASGPLMTVDGFNIKLSEKKRTAQLTAEPAAVVEPEQVAPPVVEVAATPLAPTDIIQENKPAPDSLAAVQQAAAKLDTPLLLTDPVVPGKDPASLAATQIAEETGDTAPSSERHNPLDRIQRVLEMMRAKENGPSPSGMA